MQIERFVAVALRKDPGPRSGVKKVYVGMRKNELIPLRAGKRVDKSHLHIRHGRWFAPSKRFDLRHKRMIVLNWLHPSLSSPQWILFFHARAPATRDSLTDSTTSSTCACLSSGNIGREMNAAQIRSET